MTRSVAVTGSRTTEHRPFAHYAALFERYLAPFAPGGHFHLGGMRGVGGLALEWLAERTDAELTVVLPGTLHDEPLDARRLVDRARERIAQIVELGASPVDADAYAARNRRLVDHTDMTIAFPVGTSRGSATWQTLEYTAEQGKPRLVVPI
ncbi:hypothetical protein [Streptomyces cacaoi]|uniref:hypothetical protein n=1 Tax=Streptomyces cacaoi TaxID=1898 RepID=UPI003749FBCE